MIGIILLRECDKEQILLLSGDLLLYILRISITPATCNLYLIIFQIWCHSYVKRVSRWLPIILIILSNDVNLNPGPGTHSQNNLFNYMSWNVSLAKDNFQRVRLIEAHNSIFNYDLISICETSLNDSVELPDTLLNDYTFVPANNPVNTRNGGVGLFYKNSLPVLVRNDLSLTYRLWLNEKIFFTVLYRTPFNLFNFENLYLLYLC